MIYSHVLNRGGLGVVSPVDVVLGSRPPAERPGVVQIDGEASPPIARSTARMAIDNRRQIEDLSENARAPVVRNKRDPGGANGIRQVCLLMVRPQEKPA
jgi:hypothetical protein